MATQTKSTQTKSKTKSKPAAAKAEPKSKAKKAVAAAATQGMRAENKSAEKIRNLSAAELQHQQSELSDQLFRLKFQLRMGQTDSLKKLRALRKDIARVQTISRGRELGIEQLATGTEKK